MRTWLGGVAPPTELELRGQVALLVFWSARRPEVLREIAALTRPFERHVRTIGVHVAHSERERDRDALEALIERHSIALPVLDDATGEIALAFGAPCVPALVCLDQSGAMVASMRGDAGLRSLARVLAGLVGERDPRHALELSRASRDARDDATHAPRSTLRFPTKVLVASETKLFLADTGHHRVLELDYEHARRRAHIVRVFGSGRGGWHDAETSSAYFRSPHGLARRGRTLFVADTGNHVVRAIDLVLGDVRTIAGTGSRAESRVRVGVEPAATALSAPLGIAVVGHSLHVALGESRQLWALDEDRCLRLVAGNGRDALVDGFAPQASFQRPCDVVTDGRRLFVIDAEARAIRCVELHGHPTVRTLVAGGMGADFDTPRLERPMGIAYDGLLHVADAHGNQLKCIDPETRAARTIAGTGERGYEDGLGAAARFANPEGVAVRNGFVFVVDTDNHALRVIEAGAENVVSTVEID